MKLSERSPEELAWWAQTHNYSPEQAVDLIVRYHVDDEINEWCEIVEQVWETERENQYAAFLLGHLD